MSRAGSVPRPDRAGAPSIRSRAPDINRRGRGAPSSRGRARPRPMRRAARGWGRCAASVSRCAGCSSSTRPIGSVSAPARSRRRSRRRALHCSSRATSARGRRCSIRYGVARSSSSHQTARRCPLPTRLTTRSLVCRSRGRQRDGRRRSATPAVRRGAHRPDAVGDARGGVMAGLQRAGRLAEAVLAHFDGVMTGVAAVPRRPHATAGAESEGVVRAPRAMDASSGSASSEGDELCCRMR